MYNVRQPVLVVQEMLANSLISNEVIVSEHILNELVKKEVKQWKFVLSTLQTELGKNIQLKIGKININGRK